MQLFARFLQLFRDPFDLHKAGYEMHKALQSNMDKVNSKNMMAYNFLLKSSMAIEILHFHIGIYVYTVDFLLPVARDSRDVMKVCVENVRFIP